MNRILSHFLAARFFLPSSSKFNPHTLSVCVCMRIAYGPYHLFYQLKLTPVLTKHTYERERERGVGK